MIHGIKERMKFAAIKADKTLLQISQEIGCDKKTLYDTYSGTNMHTGNIARFCVSVNCDANWLLGLKNEYKKLY